MENPSRRAFLGILAAPAIVRVTSLMPIRGIILPPPLMIPFDIEMGVAIIDMLDMHKMREELIRSFCIPEEWLRAQSL